MTVKTSLIVAMAENRCIGKDNQMPWHISDDLKRFKALTIGNRETIGHPVIMGRKTFESILGYLNKPLPNRANIVISRSGFETEHNIAILDDISAAIERGKTIATMQEQDEIFIIGGAQIYTQSIEHADRVHLTMVHQSVDGDAFFPEINMNEWHETDREDHLSHDPPYSFLTLERR